MPSKNFEKIETAEDNNGASSASEGKFSQDIVCEEPPKKCFHFNRILEAKWKEGLKRTATLPLGKAEIEKYFLTVDAAAEKVDPIVYWTSQHPLLSSVALDILAIPATSALRHIKDWVQLFCTRCLNYPWGGRYRTTNRKPVVSM